MNGLLSRPPSDHTRASWLIPSVLAFVLWGAWAMFVNRDQSFWDMLRAGCVQGVASFLITIAMKLSIARLYIQMNTSRFLGVLPALLTVTVTSSALISVHLINGTAELFTTVLPPITVALAYGLYVNLVLAGKWGWRKRV